MASSNQNPDLLKSNYFYDLPAERIADRPAARRDESKLLIYHAQSGEVVHTTFKEIANYLPKNSCLVLNNSKVFPCRLYGRKPSGGKVELFLLSLIPNENGYPAMIKSSGKKNVGDVITCGDINFTIINKKPDYSFEVTCNLNPNELLDYLESNAHIPIPPYIRQGIADERDKSDYQTTYAKKSGSVAAPTAGLHFTQEVFQSLEDKGIEKAFVTLHVGAGTFLPVKTDDITEHEMHSELYEIERSELEKMQNKDLIAVGTTSLRVLESCWDNAVKFEPPMKETNIFLHPGIEVKSIKGLITNFHLPESSLIMLVSALIGREKTLELYQLAIEKEYRFFSYGDAMLILR